MDGSDALYKIGRFAQSRFFGTAAIRKADNVDVDAGSRRVRTRLECLLRLHMAGTKPRRRSKRSMTLKIRRAEVGENVLFNLSGRMKAEHVAEMQSADTDYRWDGAES